MTEGRRNSEGPVVLVGCGAQARYALEIFALTGVAVAAVFDPIGGKVGGDLEGHQIFAYAGPNSVREVAPGAHAFLVCMSDTAAKEAVHVGLAATGFEPVSAVHPGAVVARRAKIEPGAIVNALAVLQPDAMVGTGVMVHAGAIIEHDCVLEPFSSVGPGARLAGRVRVGRGACIFTGASVIPNLSIGAGAVVGAGAAVIRDVREATVVVGVPAKEQGF